MKLNLLKISLIISLAFNFTKSTCNKPSEISREGGNLFKMWIGWACEFPRAETGLHIYRWLGEKALARGEGDNKVGWGEKKMVAWDLITRFMLSIPFWVFTFRPFSKFLLKKKSLQRGMTPLNRHTLKVLAGGAPEHITETRSIQHTAIDFEKRKTTFVSAHLKRIFFIYNFPRETF